jgi:hypothetical protein
MKFKPSRDFMCGALGILTGTTKSPRLSYPLDNIFPLSPLSEIAHRIKAPYEQIPASPFSVFT